LDDTLFFLLAGFFGKKLPKQPHDVRSEIQKSDSSGVHGWHFSIFPQKSSETSHRDEPIQQPNVKITTGTNSTSDELGFNS